MYVIEQKCLHVSEWESLIRYVKHAWYHNLSAQLKSSLAHHVQTTVKVIEKPEYQSFRSTLYTSSLGSGEQRTSWLIHPIFPIMSVNFYPLQENVD